MIDSSVPLKLQTKINELINQDPNFKPTTFIATINKLRNGPNQNKKSDL